MSMKKRPIDVIVRDAAVVMGCLCGTAEADSTGRYKYGEAVISEKIDARYKDVFYAGGLVFFAADFVG